MLDFGLPELLLIVAIAVLTIGPDQIPTLMYKLGKFIQRVKGFQFAVSRHFDQFMEDVEAAQNKSGTIKDEPVKDDGEEAAADADHYTEPPIEKPPTTKEDGS